MSKGLQRVYTKKDVIDKPPLGYSLSEEGSGGRGDGPGGYGGSGGQSGGQSGSSGGSGGSGGSRQTPGGTGSIPNTTDQIQEEIDKIDEPYNHVPKDPQILGMTGLNTDYAHSNKWWMYVPVANVLGKKYSNLELNLVRCSIPQILMGSTTVSFKSYQYEFPTHVVDPDTKEITIEYLIDEKWYNYRSLYKWCSGMEGQINKVIDTQDIENISMGTLLPCRVYLIDSFKNEIISFLFENCWIKTFNELALEAANPDEIVHSVTFAYSNFTIEELGS